MNNELLEGDIILENHRALLIPFSSERNIELKEVIFDDSIWTYMGQYIKTEEDFNEYVQDTLEQKDEGVCYPFLIIDKQTNQVAGSTRYGYINYRSRKCEIGWTWYGKEFQGTGLNKACKYLMLEYGFNQIGFQRIQFSVDFDNKRSQKAIEKLGAMKEGIFRNNYVDSENKSKTDVYYSIIQDEWQGVKAERFSEFISLRDTTI